MRFQKHPQEELRLEALQSYGILDTPREEEFDNLVDLAAFVCQTPIALVCLIDEHRQWFKAQVGMGARETNLDCSICSIAILGEELYEVEDATDHPLFKEISTVVGEPGVRFYAGVPLVTPEGFPLGTLCVLDTKPRKLTQVQRKYLVQLARDVMSHLQFKRSLMEAERVGEETSKFLRLITGSIPMRVAYLDREYRFRFVNEGYRRDFQLSQDQIVGHTVAEVLGDPAFTSVRPHLDRAMGGEVNTADLTVEYPFGKRSVVATFMPNVDHKGEVVGVVACTADVTLQRESERNLLRSRGWVDMILGYAEIGTWNYDPLTGAINADRNIAAIFEMDESEALNSKASAFIARIHPEEQQMAGEAFDRAVRLGEPFQIECRVTVSGKERWVVAKGFSELDKQGQLIRMPGVLIDITASKMTRAKEEAKFRALLDRAPANVAVLEGPELKFTYVNAAYSEALGKSAIGKSVREVFPNADHLDYLQPIERVLQTGEPFEAKQMPVVLDSESEVPALYVNVLYQALRNDEGRPYGVFTHGVDVTSEVLAAKELAEREELFRTVYEQAGDDAILLLDLQGVIRAWNPAAERITGWMSSEVVGKSFEFLLDEEGRLARDDQAQMRTAIEFGKARSERWLMRKDGSRLWGIGTMTSLHQGDTQVRGFLKIFRDATQRHLEAQGVAFMRDLTEAIVDERDPERIADLALRLFGEHLGASRVALGQIVSDREEIMVTKEWGPDQPSISGTYPFAQMTDELLAALSAGRPHTYHDVDLDHAEGNGREFLRSIRAAAGVSVPIFKDGRFSDILIVHQSAPRLWTQEEVRLVRQVADRVATEIERAKAQTALRASEERFRQLVELSPATVWYSELDGKLSFISHDFYELSGLTPEESLGNGWLRAIHPDDLERVIVTWTNSLKTEEPAGVDFRIRYRDGHYRWITARAVPVRDESGKTVGWLGSNHDIHEHKTSEERLQSAVDRRTEELQLAVREAEAFNYSISHDLRSPLRAIISSASIVLEEMGPDISEEHRLLLERQRFNAMRLSVLIDELLRLSRLARVEVHREPIDLSAISKEIVQHLQTMCQIEVAPNLEGEGDPGLIRTVLDNLIENACKFSPNGGVVRVGGENGTFWVKDEGVGFENIYAEKVFLPFERLVSESEFPGTGIGLANVKRIIERHGGRVWAKSSPGQGATFFFTLS